MPVNATLTAPAEPDGVTTVTEVEVFEEMDEPADPPKVIPVTPDRLVPVIVTVVPPAVDPVEGVIDVIVGAGKYVKAPADVVVPPAVVRATSTAPADFAGVVTVTVVELTTVTEVPAVPPKVTPVAPVKLVPVIVTEVPPAAIPEVTDKDVIVGGFTYV